MVSVSRIVQLRIENPLPARAENAVLAFEGRAPWIYVLGNDVIGALYVGQTVAALVDRLAAHLSGDRFRRRHRQPVWVVALRLRCPCLLDRFERRAIARLRPTLNRARPVARAGPWCPRCERLAG